MTMTADTEGPQDPRARHLDDRDVDRVREVEVRPYRDQFLGGPDPARVPGHARLTQNGKFLDTYDVRVPDAPPRRLEGTWLWGGPLKVHFGHVMVETVTRLWAFDPARHVGVLFAARGATSVPSWVGRILAQFDVPTRRVRLLDAPMLVETLDCARPGSTMGLGPSDAYTDWLAERSLPRRPLLQRPAPSKLYIGRRHIAHKGTVLGESYYADRLLEAGFVEWRPEAHDIAEQARALRDAEEVVFMEGSAIYAVELLARSRARFHMISRRNGGSRLFEPHVAPRGPFAGLGDETFVRRFSGDGRAGPSQPSKTRRPRRILRSMIKAGLVPEQPFDDAAFEAAMRRDAAAASRDDPARLEMLLRWLDLDDRNAAGGGEGADR